MKCNYSLTGGVDVLRVNKIPIWGTNYTIPKALWIHNKDVAIRTQDDRYIVIEKPHNILLNCHYSNGLLFTVGIYSTVVYRIVAITASMPQSYLLFECRGSYVAHMYARGKVYLCTKDQQKYTQYIWNDFAPKGESQLSVINLDRGSNYHYMVVDKHNVVYLVEYLLQKKINSRYCGAATELCVCGYSIISNVLDIDALIIKSRNPTVSLSTGNGGAERTPQEDIFHNRGKAMMLYEIAPTPGLYGEKRIQATYIMKDKGDYQLGTDGEITRKNIVIDDSLYIHNFIVDVSPADVQGIDVVISGKCFNGIAPEVLQIVDKLYDVVLRGKAFSP